MYVTAYLEGDDVVEIEAHILMNRRGEGLEEETEEDREAIEATEQTEVPTNEQDTSLAQRIHHHLPYHLLRVLAVEAASAHA